VKALAGIRKGIEVLDDRRTDLQEPVPADERDGADDDDLLAGARGAMDDEGSRSALTR
jgi:hypothetical protein